MRTPSRAARRCGFTMLATTVLLFAGNSAASAGTPTSWQDPEPTTALHELMVYGGSVVGLMIGLILLSQIVHRHHYVPPTPSDDIEKAPGDEAATR